ncbi:MAG: hypothetical protein HRT44_12800 [Bdellovibrionales bacterium]|nr:hypothetical protein [Bdellovibrionales bacterium]NQZ20116.1 hypothetical protein [Bdellovibrionales bacterium]
MTRNETLLDKGIDIAIVVIGILLALSIDSCREDYKAKRQWNVFAGQFRQEAIDSQAEYKKTIEFFKSQEKQLDQIIADFKKDPTQLKGLDKFLQNYGYFPYYYPDKTLYQSLAQTGNEYLISHTDKLKLLGQYYGFEEPAQAQLTFFKENLFPEFTKFIKLYTANYKNLIKIKNEVMFFLLLQKRTAYSNYIMYEKQEEVRKKS